jgi:hypothetical protein
MVVLGLNGTGQHRDHNAAACLLIDGQITAFALNGLDALAIGPFLTSAQRKHAFEQEIPA